MLKSLAARIVFAPKDFPDAREISDELGFTTVPSKTVSTPIGAALDKRGQRARSQSVSHQRRALLLPQEVKELGPEQAIVFYEGLRPIRCRKIRYFADKRFRRRLLPAPNGPIPFRCASAPLAVTLPESVSAAPPPAEPPPGEGSVPKMEKKSVVIRDATVEDIERIESLTLEDFACDFSKVSIPDRDGPVSEPEMNAAVESFLDSLERVKETPMAEEETPRRTNGRGQSASRGNGRLTSEESDERSTSRRKRANAEAPINVIQATRRPRKNRNTPGPAVADGATPAGSQAGPERAAASPAALPHGDSDPWTVPESVRNRFVQDGHRFYFPDGAPAFKDQGRRLTTPSENTQVVHGLIEIAHSRGMDRSYRHRDGALPPGDLASGAPFGVERSRLSAYRSRTRSADSRPREKPHATGRAGGFHFCQCAL